jgi:hypothetical protein
MMFTLIGLATRDGWTTHDAALTESTVRHRLVVTRTSSEGDQRRDVVEIA